MRSAAEWNLYKEEFARLKQRLATAELSGRQKQGRARDDAILTALRFKQRGRKPSPRISKQEAQAIVQTYKLLLEQPLVTHADEVRLWASGFRGHLLLHPDEPMPRLLPTGGRLAAIANGPQTPRKAAATLANWYPHRFRTASAAIRFLERHKKLYGDDFPLASRRR